MEQKMSTELRLFEERARLQELEDEYNNLLADKRDLEDDIAPLQERLDKVHDRLRDFGHGFYKQSSKLKIQKERIEAIEKQLLIESHPKPVWRAEGGAYCVDYISRITDKRIYLSSGRNEVFYSKSTGEHGADKYWGLLDVGATIKAWEEFKSE